MTLTTEEKEIQAVHIWHENTIGRIRINKERLVKNAQWAITLQCLVVAFAISRESSWTFLCFYIIVVSLIFGFSRKIDMTIKADQTLQRQRLSDLRKKMSDDWWIMYRSPRQETEAKVRSSAVTFGEEDRGLEKLLCWAIGSAPAVAILILLMQLLQISYLV